jgi:CsoR family transcriptional regulator, copper-sensing transcriptional repressor
MSILTDADHRTDLINRLKRAEGQLRGVQRMISEGEPCLDIVGQLTAVRKALDSASVRMTVCYVGQELQARLSLDKRKGAELGAVLDDVQTMLGKVK